MLLLTLLLKWQINASSGAHLVITLLFFFFWSNIEILSQKKRIIACILNAFSCASPWVYFESKTACCIREAHRALHSVQYRNFSGVLIFIWWLQRTFSSIKVHHAKIAASSHANPTNQCIVSPTNRNRWRIVAIANVGCVPRVSIATNVCAIVFFFFYSRVFASCVNSIKTAPKIFSPKFALEMQLEWGRGAKINLIK